MTDQYKERYKKETEQIHAPADLIARTKAAVREEEARIQAERAVQTAGLAGLEADYVMRQQAFTMQKKHSWGAAARKWAYPLSAVAAIIVLVSVSMMMRGLDKSNLDSEAPYESAAAADCGGEEFAATGAEEEAAFDKEAFEEVFPEAEAAAAEAPAADEEPEDLLSEMETADTTAGMAADSEGGYEDGTASDFAAEAPASIVEDMDETKRAASSEVGEMENAMSQKEEAKEILREDTSVDITVEKVWKKPAFVSREDVETRTYQNKVFQIVKEEKGWAAYVESESGGGYVVRGEAEDLEAFLEAGYIRLEEISW